MCDSSDNENLSVCKKTIGELSADAKSFFIPSYQRGYRWGEKEVEQLFVDLWEAKEANKEYCLQPLVVMKKGTQWRVIDGQQRLTTLYILLKVLGQEPGFSLEYETRPGSKGFLANIATVKEEKRELEARKNPDYWHMWKAKEKLEEKKTDKKLDAVKQKAFASWIKAKTFFLWYEPEGKEHEIFARLNSGKIPLSNAELIKAELLSDLPPAEQSLRADAWDRMEQRLQDDDFWYFVNPEPKASRFNATRIDFLFEVWMRKKDDKVDVRSSTEIYTAMMSELEGKKDREEEECKEEKTTKKEKASAIWEQCLALFQRLHDWYMERTYYHLVGFLMRNKRSGDKFKLLTKLLRASETRDKKSFKKYLRKKCTKVLLDDEMESRKGVKKMLEEQIKSWEWGDKPGEVKLHCMLLLFNLALSEHHGIEGGRFPFRTFANVDWTLEHIHARHEEGREVEDDVKEASNTFGNMALLSRGFNSKLNNGEFTEKQDWIVKWAQNTKDCVFIPIGTRFVFCRLIDRRKLPADKQGKSVLEDSSWNEDDEQAYTNFAIEVVTNYLTQD